MPERSTLILGPSNVGKTALIASFFYSASMFTNRGVSIRVQAENEPTRTVLQRTLSFLQTGRMPFKNTYSMMEYEFLLSVIRKRKWMYRFFGKIKTQQHFRFFDSPGGAIFSLEDEDIDYAVQGECRNILVSELKDADGLILCVDASEENKKKVGGFMSGHLCFSLNNLFSLTPKLLKKRCLPHLHVKRIYLCLTKCDLWAVQEGFQGDARAQLEELEPLTFAYRLLGKGFFKTLSTFFSSTTEFAVGFSSSYGFLEGGPNSYLVGKVGIGEQLRREHLETWTPYQVLEPFVFLTTGRVLSSKVSVCSIGELDSRLPWGKE